MELNTKKCPYCGEEIQFVAKKCRHCGEWLSIENNINIEKTIVPCPVCAEDIEDGTKVCPHCHEHLFKEQKIPQHSWSEETKQTGSDFKEKDSNQTNSTIIESYEEDSIGFFQYYFVDVFIRHYADFKGKISRKQFWMGYLCSAMLITVIICADILIRSPFIITMIVSLALTVPGIAFIVRRLHDIEKNGWWFFIACIPLVGLVWLLVLLCKKGELNSRIVKHTLKDTIVWSAGGVIILCLVFSLFFRGDTGNYNKLPAVKPAVEKEQIEYNMDFPIEEESSSKEIQKKTIKNVGNTRKIYELLLDDNTFIDEPAWKEILIPLVGKVNYNFMLKQYMGSPIEKSDGMMGRIEIYTFDCHTKENWDDGYTIEYTHDSYEESEDGITVYLTVNGETQIFTNH